MKIRKTMGAAAVATLAMGAFQWTLAYPEAHAQAGAPLEPVARHASFDAAQAPLSYADERTSYVTAPARTAAPVSRPSQALRIAGAVLRFVFG